MGITWEPPNLKGNNNMNDLRPLLIMAAITLTLLGLGSALIASDQTAAGWTLLAAGVFGSLITMGQAIKSDRL